MSYSLMYNVRTTMRHIFIMYSFIFHTAESGTDSKSSLPDTWDLNKMISGYAEVKLDKYSDEYRQVKDAFFSTSGHGVIINEVYNVQH